MDLFEMFADNEEVKNFEVEQKEAAAKKVEEKKEEKKKEASKKVANQHKNEDKKSTPKPKADPNKDIEKKLKEFPTIIVKVFGNEIVTFEGEDEVNSIKLNELTDRLVNEYQCGEFSEGASWHVFSNKDKTVGYLVATYQKFYAKG